MKRITTFISLLVCALLVSAQTFTPKYELINKADYPTNDLAVATLNVMDYGADNTGTKDCSALVQQMLDYLAGVGTSSSTRGDYSNLTGGILYMPEGKYLFTQPLILPRGVTIRGDWRKPERGKPIQGTVILVRTGSLGEMSEALSFIRMQPTSEVSNLTFFYPRQNYPSGTYKNQIVKYPPTILYGAPSYFGNDFCNVRHCTFVNSYTAIKFSTTNGGGCPNVFDIYGTPLYEGVVMDHIADVGRIDGVHFAPWIWNESGLPNAPAAGQFDDYIYNNATGIVMRRIDWSYTANIDVEGYWRGFWCDRSRVSGDLDSKPNGQNYKVRLKDCQIGVNISATSGAGVMFAKVSTDGCETGLLVDDSSDGPVQFFDCELEGSQAAVNVGSRSGATVFMQDCQLTGPTLAQGGQLIANNNTFNRDVFIGPAARTVFTGNSFTEGASLRNNSLFKCEVSDAKYATRAMPEFKDEWMEIKQTRPARAALYVVTDAEFGAKPQPQSVDIDKAPDCTAAIQAALDKASSEGGGIVYLPPGHYHMDRHLTIPTGVELKGAGDIATVPKRNGAMLEVYENEGNEDGAPFISMEPGSGLRGVTFDYPVQNDPRNVRKFPYTIRGNANVYMVNVGIRTAYKGVDLFTNKCDNHYVDYLAGHAFTNVIRVGGGSENGIISNIQCNTNVYGTAYETKWGCWPNSTNLPREQQSPLAGGQNAEDLDFMIIGDSRNQVIYNNFLFGCNIGMHFVDDGNGGAVDVHSMGNAVDGAVKTVVVDAIGSDLDLINSQIVALNHDKANEIIKGAEDAYFYKLGPNVKHAVTLFASDNWGGGRYFADVQGGQLNLYLANLNASGGTYTFNTGAGGKVVLFGGKVNNLHSLVKTRNTNEPNIQIVSSVSNDTGANKSLFALWQNVLPATWSMTNTSIYLSRSRWFATAFNDVNGTGQARNAIDDNPTTRWSTTASQANGQWFMVNMQAKTLFNTIILDTSESANDGPAAYYAEVHDADTDTWTTVAEGQSGGAILILTFNQVEADMVRITQTGSKGNYWSIHEFNLANMETIGICPMLSDEAQGPFNVYDLRGMRVATGQSAGAADVVQRLPRGIYVVRYANGQTVKVKN